jgi:hypothetical protein
MIRINRKKTIKTIIALLISLCLASLLVPINPGMPSAGLDPSWVLGMSESLTQGFKFGSDIVFTFGPFSQIYTNIYNEKYDILIIFSAIYLTLCYTFLLFIISINNYKIILIIIVLFTTYYSKDTLLLLFPLISGLSIIFIIDFNKSCNKVLALIVSLSPLGLLPLVKGSLIPVCIVAVVLGIIYLSYTGNKKYTLLALSPVLTLSFFWVASGQSLLDIYYYFSSSFNIIFGYTEGMHSSYIGAPPWVFWQLISYILVFIILEFTIIFDKKLSHINKYYISISFGIFLFLSFKAGFVRHDGHAMTAGYSILTASILLAVLDKTKYSNLLIALSLFVLILIDSQFIKFSTDKFLANISNKYLLIRDGLNLRINNSEQISKNYQLAIKNLKSKEDLPDLKGTVDIYSHNQSGLISSGNKWNPRPVFQSYAAYTPQLQELNRKHLVKHDSPDNIIFRVQPIDGRLASIEDGPSWIELLRNYSPTNYKNGNLFLEKNIDKKNNILNNEVHLQGYANFKETVEIHSNGGLVFLKLNIQKNFIGRLLNFLFKPTELIISLKLKNGNVKKFRIISGMVQSGFLLSPLVEETSQFGMLYGRADFLDSQKVTSFSIDTLGRFNLFWTSQYKYDLNKVENIYKNNDVSKIFKIAYPVILTDLDSSKIATCNGVIDHINNAPPVNSSTDVNGMLRVNGWMTLSIKDGTLPNQVFLTLTDSYNKTIYYKTDKIPRPDVGAYLKNPLLNNSGYSINADISNLSGSYKIGLAIKDADGVKNCPQFSFPIKVVK